MGNVMGVHENKYLHSTKNTCMIFNHYFDEMSLGMRPIGNLLIVSLKVNKYILFFDDVIYYL